MYLVDPRLKSEDLEPGFVIPEKLKKRWQIIIGTSTTKLPPLLEKIGKIDIFIHDSLHTYENMFFEYETAYPYIESSGLLISHDVDDEKSAFIDFCDSKRMEYFIKDFIGVAIKK